MNCSACNKKRGRRGPPGPPGPSTETLLKFSGRALRAADATPVPSFLADAGTGGAAPVITVPPSYPVVRESNARKLTVNLQTALAGAATLTVELLRNGVLVPGFSIAYSAGGTASGVQSVEPAEALFAADDLLDVRTTTTGPLGTELNVSAQLALLPVAA